MAENGEHAPVAAVKSGYEKSKERVHHTVTACVRCRQRKTRCDATLPRCEPCERSNSVCEYFDSSKNTVIPRTYITSLQETVRKLNNELKELDGQNAYHPDDASMARAGGLVKFSESDESRFLGPSSGIAVTRFVMEFARQNSVGRTIRDIVPDHAAQEIKDKFDAESQKPTSKVYPLISSVAAPSLPNRDLMDQLVNIYMVKAQYMLPLLHEPTFRQEVDLVYNGSQDPTMNFQVRMVVAISMQKLDTQYAGLADSYYLAALPFLTDAVRKKDVSTLQCFVLIGQYSLLTPTRTAAYWVVGFATKLAQELGICEEHTIEKPPSGARPTFLETDMRRRLFWIVTSMEYGLSHSLGRPSALGVSVDNINVKFFEQCDDRFIAPDGLLPGHHPVMKKCISIHFFKMRLLQAEIRRTLYLRKRDTPVTDNDPWFSTMLTKIDDWVRNTPKNDEGSGLSEAWFIGRKNTMIVFMYRPSPQIPRPSLRAAQYCYDAAVFNINLQKRQVENRLIDITWIFTQAICMALNTVLWSLSYPEIRQQHPLEEVKTPIEDALSAIGMCADRWPGVRSAHQLYGNLIHGCLRAYDHTNGVQSRVQSPASNGNQHASTNDFSSSASQTANSPASTGATSFFGHQSPQSYTSHPSSMLSSGHIPNQNAAPFGSPRSMPLPTHQPLDATTMSSDYPSYSALSSPAQGASVLHDAPNYTSVPQGVSALTTTQDLPSSESLTFTELAPGYANFSDMSLDNQPWLASYGDQYPQFMGQSYGLMSHQVESLNEQGQIDLLASLEKSQLPDVSGLVSDATTFYTAQLP